MNSETATSGQESDIHEIDVKVSKAADGATSCAGSKDYLAVYIDKIKVIVTTLLLLPWII
jgi:hypothetical protein